MTCSNLIQWFKQISMKSDIFSGWTFKTFLRYFCFHNLWIQVFRCKYHKSSATKLLSTKFKFKVGLNNKCQLVVKWFLIFWKIFFYNFSTFLSNNLSHKTLEFDIDKKNYVKIKFLTWKWYHSKKGRQMFVIYKNTIVFRQ